MGKKWVGVECSNVTRFDRRLLPPDDSINLQQDIILTPLTCSEASITLTRSLASVASVSQASIASITSLASEVSVASAASVLNETSIAPTISLTSEASVASALFAESVLSEALVASTISVGFLASVASEAPPHLPHPWPLSLLPSLRPSSSLPSLSRITAFDRPASASLRSKEDPSRRLPPYVSPPASFSATSSSADLPLVYVLTSLPTA